MVRIPADSREVTDAETGIAIRISTGEFLLSPHEVTQVEYEVVMGLNPSVYKGAQRPVENVTWWDAIRYANHRSVLERLQPVYDLATGRADLARNGYRLPTEAEWEVALTGADPKQANLGSSNTKQTGPLVQLVTEKGTKPVGSFAANKLGLHDMLGNVWEWTGDYFDPVAATVQQQAHGVARTIRGGSFVSTVSGWSKGYRSSMPAGHKSRYTGFRVARTVSAAVHPISGSEWFRPYQQPPSGFETATGALTPLLASTETVQTWAKKRSALREKWRGILGAPAIAPPAPNARLIESYAERGLRGSILELQTEPDSWEKILVLQPAVASSAPLPVVIVPYYDVDVPAGRNLGGRSFMAGSVRSYAYLAAQRGYMAIAIRWFGESYGERYDEAVANLAMRHPQSTGLGKWVWDAQRLLDYIGTMPDADSKRIAIIGHSLGAKMALYAAAMDDRIGNVIFSEGGIGFKMSNYDDFWYLGEKMKSLPAGTDQHELMALLAPRPFLLIGGDEYDGNESWHYINAARAVYGLFQKPEQIGYFNHHKGHSPTQEAISHAMRWLERFTLAARLPTSAKIEP
ncbi:MAG: SUMF1/EgtB/PvdO family nonheme iron enzyme [Bryobacterales bacterium]|nr:SUMF1/EgtB/PvdO family nonheme iron enzyme [Bryobacterales bacterium]